MVAVKKAVMFRGPARYSGCDQDKALSVSAIYVPPVRADKRRPTPVPADRISAVAALCGLNRIAHRCGAALVAAECAAVSAVGLGREGRTQEATERRKEATLGFGNVEAKWHRDRWLKAWNEASVPDQA
jgi:hypothetical protein